VRTRDVERLDAVEGDDHDNPFGDPRHSSQRRR
jgi:hypothetical protein